MFEEVYYVINNSIKIVRHDVNWLFCPTFSALTKPALVLLVGHNRQSKLKIPFYLNYFILYFS